MIDKRSGIYQIVNLVNGKRAVDIAKMYNISLHTLYKYMKRATI